MLVAIDIRQVVNGTTIHVNEMARQLGGSGGERNRSREMWRWSIYETVFCGLKVLLLGLFVVVILERWLSRPGFIAFILAVK